MICQLWLIMCILLILCINFDIAFLNKMIEKLHKITIQNFNFPTKFWFSKLKIVIWIQQHQSLTHMYILFRYHSSLNKKVFIMTFSIWIQSIYRKSFSNTFFLQQSQKNIEIQNHFSRNLQNHDIFFLFLLITHPYYLLIL